MLEPEQATGGVEVNLMVLLPEAEVGVKPQLVGSELLPVTRFPVPEPPPSRAQLTVEPEEADEPVNIVVDVPHCKISGPALAAGDADQVMTITSLVLEQGAVPFTFSVIVT